MLNLKFHIYKSGKPEPEIKISIPFSALNVAGSLLPKKVKSYLEKSGINITDIFSVFPRKQPRGTLIEIDDLEDKIVILVD